MEILPCPFCGGKADSHCTTGDYPDWFVQCEECGASADVTGPGDLHFWNRRQSTQAEPKAPKLTDDLREILGRPNFTCHHIAKALRVMGLTIAPKSDDEQAVVIHWLLGHYLKHGADWRKLAAAELEAASKAMKA